MSTCDGRVADRYRISDLEKYVLSAKQKRMRDLESWKEYNWEYISIAGWLMSQKKLQEQDRDLYFWKGIPCEFRKRLESAGY